MAHREAPAALPSLGRQRIRSRAMTKPLARYTDIHTHDTDRACTGSAIVSLRPGQPMLPGGTYSVGIHPWDTERPVTLATLRALVAAARDPRVVAIGECGIDRLRGGDIAVQQAVFDFHARLAARLHKPLIIHDVHADDLLLAAIRRHRPAPGMWIIHGYRGKPAAAETRLRAGFGLSLGLRYNPATAAVIPSDRLHHETD